MNEAVQFRIHVEGRVQGVSFRAHARRVAEELGLAGSAMNETNGSVTIVVEGARDTVERFMEWCKSGPPRARVDHLTWDEAEAAGLQGFRVG